MNKWERRLRREGLGMSRGRDRRLGYSSQAYADFSHGLVSPVYALSPGGEYFTDEERSLRAKQALKYLIRKHGHRGVRDGLRAARVSKEQESVRERLLEMLQRLWALPESTGGSGSAG